MREGNAPRGAEGKCRMHHSYEFLLAFRDTFGGRGWDCVVRRKANNTVVGRAWDEKDPETGEKYFRLEMAEALEIGRRIAAREYAKSGGDWLRIRGEAD